MDEDQKERRGAACGADEEALQGAGPGHHVRLPHAGVPGGHNYGFKTEHRVSLLTPSGHVIVPYTGYEQHVARIERGAHIGSAKLWYDQPKKRFYLLVSLEVEVAGPTPAGQTSVVGLDVGIRAPFGAS